MKKEIWKTIGISALTSVVIFVLLYFAAGQVLLSPTAVPIGSGPNPSALINANQCTRDGTCEMNSASVSDTICLGGECRDSWSDDAIWLKAVVTHDLTMGWPLVTIQNMNTQEDICYDKRIGDSCRIQQYTILIMDAYHSPEGKSVTLVLGGSSGAHLIPAPAQLKMTRDTNSDVSYNSNSGMEFIILP